MSLPISLRIAITALLLMVYTYHMARLHGDPHPRIFNKWDNAFAFIFLIAPTVIFVALLFFFWTPDS